MNRKHMGHDHIAAKWAGEVNEFYANHFNPYLHFHRPCGVPEIIPEQAEKANSKAKRLYRWYATPREVLRQLPDLARHMKGDLTTHDLERERASKPTRQPPAKCSKSSANSSTGSNSGAARA